MPIRLNKVPLLHYESDADVLSWEISKDPIEYASEVGNFIVHFSKDHQPVFIEVLQAKEFTRTAERTVGIQRVHPEMVIA